MEIRGRKVEKKHPLLDTIMLPPPLSSSTPTSCSPDVVTNTTPSDERHLTSSIEVFPCCNQLESESICSNPSVSPDWRGVSIMHAAIRTTRTRPLGYIYPFKTFSLTGPAENRSFTQKVIPPDRRLLVSISVRKVEFPSFPY